MYNKPVLTKHDSLRNITFSREYLIKSVASGRLIAKTTDKEQAAKLADEGGSWLGGKAHRRYVERDDGKESYISDRGWWDT